MNTKSETVYRFIIEYKKAHDGVAPTMREIMAACGISTSSHVSYVLQQLVEDGRITLGDGSRNIYVVNGRWLLEAQP